MICVYVVPQCESRRVTLAEKSEKRVSIFYYSLETDEKWRKITKSVSF